MNNRRMFFLPRRLFWWSHGVKTMRASTRKAVDVVWEDCGAEEMTAFLLVLYDGHGRVAAVVGVRDEMRDGEVLCTARLDNRGLYGVVDATIVPGRGAEDLHGDAEVMMAIKILRAVVVMEDDDLFKTRYAIEDRRCCSGDDRYVATTFSLVATAKISRCFYFAQWIIHMIVFRRRCWLSSSLLVVVIVVVRRASCFCCARMFLSVYFPTHFRLFARI